MEFETPFSNPQQRSGGCAVALSGAAAGSGFVPCALTQADAAHKLLAAFVFSVCISALDHIPSAGLACLASLLLLGLFRLPWRRVFKMLLPANFFFLFLWLTLPLSFSAPGSVQELGQESGLTDQAQLILRLGPLYIYQSGLLLAALITLKGNAIAAMLLALAGTSGISENCRALRRLHVPEKLVMLLLLTQANLSILAQEAANIKQAARLRGFKPRTSLAAYRTLAWLAGLLLARAWQRAKRVEEAMRLRGFDSSSGCFPLFSDNEAKGGKRLLAVVAAGALLILFIDTAIL